MVRVNQIKVSPFVYDEELEQILRKKVIKKLNIDEKLIEDISIFRRSFDARKKEDISYVYSLDVKVSNEKKIKSKDKDISFVSDKKYEFGFINESETSQRPVIIGLGPAGLFCAYMLAEAGFRPIVFERGKRVENRTRDVAEFWANGKLLKNSNVQFGEGGAGTFSDGKLNTLVKDRFGRNKEVLRLFVQFGAPENILYDNKPHIGTDVLVNVVTNMRNAIINMGAEIHYDSCVSDILIDNNKVCGVKVNDEIYEAKDVVLAIGHSARDTFERLYELGIKMTPKAFAVGMRVMHPQNLIDINQYGENNLNRGLPVADYKLTHTASNGRGVYSFCMCPGGHVVNASSEDGMLAVNGMSYHARDSKDANSAIVVQVTPEDYGSNHVLSGMKFQRELEKRAFNAGNGNIPVQRYGDFRNIINPILSKEGLLEVEPVCRGDYKWSDLTNILPSEVSEAFVEGMERFGDYIKGFNDGNAILAGVESRTSSPVRIERNEKGISSCLGLYPCGEGAGYAGGITSAAMDGIYIAECVGAAICAKGDGK